MSCNECVLPIEGEQQKHEIAHRGEVVSRDQRVDIHDRDDAACIAAQRARPAGKARQHIVAQGGAGGLIPPCETERNSIVGRVSIDVQPVIAVNSGGFTSCLSGRHFRVECI